MSVEDMKIEALIDQYGDDILRLCLLYLGDRQLAEDAFQETFVKAWKGIQGFKGESSVKTWLSRIAANTCRSMLRSPWLRMRKSSRSVDELLNLPAPEAVERSSLMLAVCSLPDKYREIVVLHYHQDMKIREIAQLLRIPVNTVSTRLRKARKLLGAALEGEDDA